MGAAVGQGMQRSFVGSSSHGEELRFLRMTAHEMEVVDHRQFMVTGLSVTVIFICLKTNE